MDHMIAIAIIITVFLIVVSFEIKRNRLLNKYWLRACAGSDWKKQYPNEPKDDIRDFLIAFVDSFGFRRKRILNFRPTDKIMDVYRAAYPINGLPDALELETFAKQMKKQYGLVINKDTNINITLGEIFELTRRDS